MYISLNIHVLADLPRMYPGETERYGLEIKKANEALKKNNNPSRIVQRSGEVSGWGHNNARLPVLII